MRWALGFAGCLALFAALAGVLLLAPSGAAGPGTGSWAPTEPPSVARSEHAALTLSDGGVLVAGGADSTGPLAAVEHFDGAADRWKLLAFLKVRRKLHSATLTSGARVLVAGGIGANGALSSAELYDPLTNSWELTRGSLGAARSGHSATALADGKVLVAGGAGPLSSNSWDGCEAGLPDCGSQGKSGNLALERNGSATLTLLDGPECRAGSPPAYCGKALLVGGGGIGTGPNVPTARTELYDPATGRWSSCDSAGASAGCPAPFPGGPVREHTAAGWPPTPSSARRWATCVMSWGCAYGYLPPSCVPTTPR